MNALLPKSLIAVASLVAAAAPAAQAAAAKPTIVLVHGAFADASGWGKVILQLQRDGYPVQAVQNPLTSLPDDIATTKRTLDAIKTPVVLVGHSYGGTVITGAAVGSPNVRSLVYIAAFAPDIHEPTGALAGKFGHTDLDSAIRPVGDGFLALDPALFHQAFCADLPADESAVMAVTQKPLAAAAFGATLPQAAWKTLPSYYLVASDDHAIRPELERFMAQRIGAKKIEEVKSSHVPFLSHPDVVVQLIEAAAQ